MKHNESLAAPQVVHACFCLLVGVLRVLVNVTHNTATGCACVYSFDGITEVLLKSILQTPQYVLEEQRYVHQLQ